MEKLNKYTTEKLTVKQLEQGFDELVNLFPENAQILETHREEILTHIVNDTAPTSDSPLSTTLVQPKEMPLEAIKLTQCEEDIANVTVDVIFFVWGLVGLHVSAKQQVKSAVIKKLTPNKMAKILDKINDFVRKTKATDKAASLFNLFQELWNVGVFGAALSVAKSKMSIWEWAKTGVIALAQITAWVASGGTAFIAEAALSVMDAEALIEDSVKAVHDCGNKKIQSPDEVAEVHG